MKNTKSIIPLKLREEMSKDPFYASCSLYGQILGGQKHECEGKITWEHTLTYAGSKIQEKWAIIPLCEKYHAVNWFQDSGCMIKEINVWVALNRATDDELRSKCKVINYIRERKRLNALYGLYTHVVPAVPQISPREISWSFWSNRRLLDEHAVLIHQLDAMYLANSNNDHLQKDISKLEDIILSRMHHPESVKMQVKSIS